MFDNKNAPQDIFAGVEPPTNLPVSEASLPGATPSGISEQAPVITPPSVVDKIVTNGSAQTSGHVWKTVLIVLIAFTVMGLAAVFAYSFINSSESDDDNDSLNASKNEDDTDPDLLDGKGGGDNADGEPEIEVVLDNDGDGLTNEAEQAAGTSVSKPDTDSDLLGDREEVQVYGTDPLRADTDGDTFTDGQEVRAGYNPNGTGKILELPSE